MTTKEDTKMRTMEIGAFGEAVKMYMPSAKQCKYTIKSVKRKRGFSLYVYHQDPAGVVGIECRVMPKMLREDPQREASTIAKSIDKEMTRFYHEAKGTKESANICWECKQEITGKAWDIVEFETNGIHDAHYKFCSEEHMNTWDKKNPTEQLINVENGN